MKKTYLLLGFCFLGLTALTIWLSQQAEDVLPFEFFYEQRLPQILRELPTESEINVTTLLTGSRPEELQNPENFLPTFHKYDPDEMMSLYAYSLNCDPHKISKISAELIKALHWLQFACGTRQLPKTFFKYPPYVFPSGKSYVRLAEDIQLDLSSFLTADEKAKYKGVPEVLEETQWGKELNLQQTQGLLAIEDFVFAKSFVLIQRKNTVESQKTKLFDRVSLAKWNKALENEDYVFTQRYTKDCFERSRNGCWMVNKERSVFLRKSYFVALIVFDGLFIAAFIILFAIDRRRRARQKENQRFTLQMLTHELRTPVTTLSLLLENTRSNFDQLSEAEQINFLQMSREISRLKHSMQMSYAYLQTDTVSSDKLKLCFDKIDCVSFVKSLVEQQNLEGIQISTTHEIIFIEAERFWLDLCLNNLVRNAYDHGIPPVRLSISCDQISVLITVEDAGTIEQSNLQELYKPFQKRKHSKGLGLGLSIIDQIMREMKGQLLIKRNPSRFTLQFRRLL